MMKSISILIILVLLSVSILVAQDSKNLIISTSKAGNFVIGMTKDDVYSLCNNYQINDKIEEGEEDYYLELQIYFYLFVLAGILYYRTSLSLLNY